MVSTLLFPSMPEKTLAVNPAIAPGRCDIYHTSGPLLLTPLSLLCELSYSRLGLFLGDMVLHDGLLLLESSSGKSPSWPSQERSHTF